MNKLYPLTFAKSKEDIKNNSATSKECVESAIISNGFLMNNSLEEVVETYMGSLLGERVFDYFTGNLPITIRFYRSDNKGEVIVSPDEYNARTRWDSFGKERLLIVCSAKENSKIFVGFKEDISAQHLYELMQSKKITEAMNSIEAKRGENIFVPAGVPYSVEEGIELIEIAHNSPIDLNIENFEMFSESLDFINLNKHISLNSLPKDNFIKVEKITLTRANSINLDDFESFIFLATLNGGLEIEYANNQSIVLGKEEIAMLPHDLTEITIRPQSATCEVIRAYMAGIPIIERESSEFENDIDEDCDCNDENCDHHHHNHHHHENCTDCECDHDHECDGECDDECCNHHNHDGECNCKDKSKRYS